MASRSKGGPRKQKASRTIEVMASRGREPDDTTGQKRKRVSRDTFPPTPCTSVSLESGSSLALSSLPGEEVGDDDDDDRSNLPGGRSYLA